MIKHLRSLLLLIMIALGACSEKLELPQGTGQKIVLLGEMVAEETMYIRAGQSTPVKNGSVYNRELVKNLSIEVRDETGTVSHLLGVEDDLSSSEYTLAFSSQLSVQAGVRYEVQAVHELMSTATVSVSIPKAFHASVSDTQTVVYNAENCLKLNVEIADGAEKNYYLIEVLQQPYTVEPAFLFNGSWIKKGEHPVTYDSLITAGVNVQEKMDSFYVKTYNRISVYTEDNLSEHVLIGKANQLARRVLINDNSFNGSTHLSSLFIPRSSLGLQNPCVGLRTLVQVKSITEDYFKYLQSYEQYDPFGALFNTSNAIQIPGNISNGVGLVGGVFKRTFIYHF